MEKRKKSIRFLKNRMWKSRIGNRLKGRAKDVCQDYLQGVIDHFPNHFSNGCAKKEAG